MKKLAFPLLNQIRKFKTIYGTKLLNESEVKNVLSLSGVNFKLGTICANIKCSLCKGKSDTHNLFINLKTGWFVCQHGNVWGEWSALDKYFSINEKDEKDEFIDELNTTCGNENLSIKKIWGESKKLTTLNESDICKIRDDYDISALSVDLLDLYGLKYVPSSQSILIPQYHFGNRLISLKILKPPYLTSNTIMGQNGFSIKSYLQSSESCGEQPINYFEIIDTHGLTGLFGMQTVRQHHKEVILTNNEWDAVALYQQKMRSPNSNLNKKGKVAIMALPRGNTNLPQEILPLLEQFDKITFWFSGDIRGSWESSKSFANKLDPSRCYLVQSKEGNAQPLELLKQGIDAHEIIKSSSYNLAPKSITHFQHMRQEVYTLIKDHKKFQGIEWKRFGPFNGILKGFRRGELTVFTGPTGSGKTTFISEYSLDLCMNGVNTLWGSFEIPNTRLMKIMLQQFAKKNLANNLPLFQGYADNFERLQMYFLTHYGPTNTKNVIECMSQAVYLYDISHVVIDNLQFMLGDETSVSSFDRYLKQDSAIAAFRKFATYHNCHVTLIIHPRKEMTEELYNYSIFGGAKATQEADNVMILQQKDRGNGDKFKYVQVTKNRFDGKLGIVPLMFDRETQQFTVGPRQGQVVDTQNRSSYPQSPPQAPVLMPLPNSIVQKC